MEMEKEFKRVEQEKFNIVGLVVVSDKEESVIQQIRFTLEDENTLTYKPSKMIEKEFFIKKVPVIKKQLKALGLEELPEKIVFMNNLISKNGSVSIITDYTEMTAENDELGKKSYKFLNNNDFESLRFIDENNKEIAF